MTEFMQGSRYPFRRLAHVAEIQLGKMLQAAPASSSDIEVPYMRAGHLGAFPDELPTMWASRLEVTRYAVEEGDLVVAEGGDVGRPEFVPRAAAGAIIQNSLHRVRPRNDGDSRYLRYALLAVHGSDWLDVLCNRSTFGHLTVEKLSSLRIPLPTSEHQRAIADFLDTEIARIDALIAKKRRMIDLLEERRWASFLARVGVAEGPRVPLRRALRFITDGPFGSAFTSNEYTTEGLSVIRLGNIGFAEFRDADMAYLPSERLREFSRYQLRAGDLLIAGLGDDRNHAGRACVAPDLGVGLTRFAGHRDYAA